MFSNSTLLWLYIYIGVIIQRYIQHCEITLINNMNLNKVKWYRDDYLRDDRYKGCWLMNQ